ARQAGRFAAWGRFMRVYYDRDADLGLILEKKVAVVGYGSQGHAHSLNMRDSGVKDVTVALKPGSASAAKAQAEKLKVSTVAEAAKTCHAIMIRAPAEVQAAIYNAENSPHMNAGK